MLRPSLAQAKLATVEVSIVGRRLGRLADDDLAALDRGLREALGLTENAVERAFLADRIRAMAD